MGRSGIRSLVVNAGYIFGARAGTMLLRAVYAIALASYLGPETYGLFNYAMSWYLAFLPLTFWGMNVIMSREVGRDRRGEGARIVNVAAGARLVTTAAAALLCLGTGLLLEQHPGARLLIAAFTLALVGRSLATWVNDVFAAHESASHILRVEGSLRSIETLIGLAALALGFGIWTVLAIHLVTWWAQALIGMAVLRRRVAPVEPLFDRRALLALLRTGLPLAVMVFFNGWLLQGPLILYRHLADDKAGLGQLALAMQFTGMLSQAIAAVSIAALPILSRSVERADNKDLLFVVWMIRLGVVFGATAAILGTAAGPWLVSVLFDGTYAQAGELLGPALWLLVPLAAGSGLNQRFLAQRRDRVPMTSSALGAAVMFSSAPFLVEPLGPIGVIAAAGAGRIAAVALSLAVLVRERGRDGSAGTLRLLTGLGATVATFYLLRPEGAAIASATAISILAVTSYFLLLSHSERTRMTSLLKSRRRGS